MRGTCVPMAKIQHPREYLTSGPIQGEEGIGKRNPLSLKFVYPITS